MGAGSILLAILGLSVLVIIHEGGHYLAARAFKMRVTRYSIGFGPTLFKYRPKGSPTTFQVAAIPFLAYVQIAGMNPHEEVDPKDPEIYPNKSVFARIVVIAAGPVANYLTASVLVFGLALAGWPSVPKTPVEVAQVQPDSAAREAGVRPGDVILRANGERVRDFEHLVKLTGPRKNRPTEYVIRRDGRVLSPITITPRDEDGRGIIGVLPAQQPMYTGVGGAAKAAVVLPLELTVAQLVGIADLMKRCSSEGVMGPVGMGKMVAEQASRGWIYYLSILMMLSVALGLFNLLPFPALDGGRLMFLAYEVITRRRPNERFEAMVHTVGIIFLLCVLVLVTFRDVMS
jgi:regulator of sigma E protease